MKLYYHKTDGGAEYLMDTYLEWTNDGKSGKEGIINDETKYIVRIDGDIEKDAELIVRRFRNEVNMKRLAMSDMGMTEDEAERAVEDFQSDS